MKHLDIIEPLFEWTILIIFWIAIGLIGFVIYDRMTTPKLITTTQETRRSECQGCGNTVVWIVKEGVVK